MEKSHLYHETDKGNWTSNTVLKMKLAKRSKNSRRLRFKQNKDKVIIGTSIPRGKTRASKSDTNLLSKKAVPERRKSSSDVDIAKNRLKEETSGTFIGPTQAERPHTQIVYATSLKRLSTLSLKIIDPLERFLEKFQLFLFKRRKNARIGTDKHWFKKTRQFEELYKKATASKTFLLRSIQQRTVYVDPVPKVVLFSLRYPSKYPYIYNRIIPKYVKEKKDGDQQNENDRTEKQDDAKEKDGK